MKYLSDYTEEKTSNCLKKAGAFFAFSEKQLQEGKKETNAKEGTKYIALGAGIICPEDTATQLVADMENVIKNGIAQDIKENGLTEIIKRELANHEAYYTGDIESTIEALADYPIRREAVQLVYKTQSTLENPYQLAT
tara:strand:- start:134 stop:547 length:414 start_codon:yes stop_codon:yes gene_type:complete